MPIAKLSTEKKWVIFDTCTISKIFKNPDIGGDILKAISNSIGIYTPAVTPLIKFEMSRSAKNQQELEQFLVYFDTLYEEVWWDHKTDIFDWYHLTSGLSHAYMLANSRHGKNVGPIDMIHAGLLRRYPQNLYIVTFDNNDFPEPLFKIIVHNSVKVGAQLEIWSLRQFDKIGSKKFLERFKTDSA